MAMLQQRLDEKHKRVWNLLAQQQKLQQSNGQIRQHADLRKRKIQSAVETMKKRGKLDFEALRALGIDVDEVMSRHIRTLTSSELDASSAGCGTLSPQSLRSQRAHGKRPRTV